MSERLYDYTLQRENGGSQNLYWGNHSKKITAEELEQMYNADDNARLRESFGSFDNYFAYMNERQDLIDSGDYKADWWNTGQPLVDVEGLGRQGGSDDRALEWDIMQEGARQGEIGYNEQADVFNNLYEKYTGESTTKYLDNGSKYEWNGSSFVMTQEAFGPHIGSMLGNALPGIVLTAGMAGPLGGMLGNATGSSALGKGLAAGLANAGGQYVSTGSVDPASVVASGVMAGLNPGGMIADKYVPWVPEGAVELGGTGDGFLNGLIKGGVNNSLSQLITTGDLDLKSALQSGLLQGGYQSFQDMLYDLEYYSPEKIAARYEQELGYSPAQAMEAALADASLYRTNLGALIGEGGLLPFIPELNMGPLVNFYGEADRFLGGILPDIFDPGTPTSDWTQEEINKRRAQLEEMYLNDEMYWMDPNTGQAYGQDHMNAWVERNMNPDWAFWHGQDGLDEKYSWSGNPRGDTEIIGMVDQITDANGNPIYSAGTDLNNYDFGGHLGQWTTPVNPLDGLDDNGILWENLDAGQVVLPSTTNNSWWETLSQSFYDGLLTRTDNNDGTTTVSSSDGSMVVDTDDLNNGLDLINNGNGGTEDVDGNGGDDVVNGNSKDDEVVASTSNPEGLFNSTLTTLGPFDTDITASTELSDNADGIVLTSGGNPEDVFNSTLGTLTKDKELSGTPPPDDLPAGGGGDTTLPSTGYSGGQGNKMPLLWSELFGYTRITPWEGARLKVLNDIVSGIEGQGMLGPQIVKEPYMKLNQDLLDAGILS